MRESISLAPQLSDHIQPFVRQLRLVAFVLQSDAALPPNDPHVPA